MEKHKDRKIVRGDERPELGYRNHSLILIKNINDEIFTHKRKINEANFHKIDISN